MTADVVKQIKEMIVERCFLSISPDDIGDDDSLMDSVGLDSVQILEVVVGLEEIFGITFEDTDFNLENFLSVNAISNYVRDRLEV